MRTPRGFTMIELIVVVAAVVILAAALSPRMFTWIDEGRSARALNDAAAVGAAMSRFFQDTTKWPGQVEILAQGSSVRFLTVGPPATGAFPQFVSGVALGAATCVSGLSGVQPGVTAFATAVPSAANSLDVIGFLTAPPSAADYPNWKGPYLTTQPGADPWGQLYVINVIPLFCGEETSAASPGGALGYGWVLSGGANATLQTPFTASRVTADSDDVGVPLGKRAVQAAAP